MKSRTSAPQQLRRDQEDGFTLVELVMAVLILVVISTVTAVTVTGALGQVSATHQKQIAIELDEQQMETLRALPPASLPCCTTTAFTTPSPEDGTFYTVTTQTNNSVVGPNFEWVQVTVTWTSSNSKRWPGNVVDQELMCAAAVC
jgi:prepilin-type N-terminal cleavage/methylation domain-containing protein